MLLLLAKAFGIGNNGSEFLLEFDWRFLGVPVMDSVAQTLGRFNILDTDQMVMGIRENFRIEMFEQDGNNVRTNRITIRAEARVAFAIAP